MHRVHAVVALLVVMVIGLGIAFSPVVNAQAPTLNDVKSKFESWTPQTAITNGYEADPFCVDGRLFGAPSLGTMGFHYVNPSRISPQVDPLNPSVVLIGPDGTSVVAVEYLVPWQPGQPAPTLFGQEFEGPMAGHSPGMPVHYDLHSAIVDNPAGQYADFNPALALCADNTLPPPPDAQTIAGIFGGMSPEAAIAIGYAADQFCIDARLFGQPQLGTMGYHYVNEALFAAPLNPFAPPILLVHPTEQRVVAVEYFSPPDAPRPSLFGQDFAPPSPEGPPFFSLHLWAETNPAGMFADFNPALPLCPEGTLPPPPGGPSVGDVSLNNAFLPMAGVGVVALIGGFGLLVLITRRQRRVIP